MARPWDALSSDERARRIRDHLGSTHVACAGCGYDLFGLAGRTCPECAAPIDDERFAFLAAERDEVYEAKRLQEYLGANRAACPACRRALDRVEGRRCPHCGEALEVWMLVPRGLPWRRNAGWKWVVLITVVYVVLAATAGVIGLMMRTR